MENREERDDLIKYLFEKLKMCVKYFTVDKNRVK